MSDNSTSLFGWLDEVFHVLGPVTDRTIAFLLVSIPAYVRLCYCIRLSTSYMLHA